MNKQRCKILPAQTSKMLRPFISAQGIPCWSPQHGDKNGSYLLSVSPGDFFVHHAWLWISSDSFKYWSCKQQLNPLVPPFPVGNLRPKNCSVTSQFQWVTPTGLTVKKTMPKTGNECDPTPLLATRPRVQVPSTYIGTCPLHPFSAQAFSHNLLLALSLLCDYSHPTVVLTHPGSPIIWSRSHPGRWTTHRKQAKVHSRLPITQGDKCAGTCWSFRGNQGKPGSWPKAKQLEQMRRG